MDFTLHQLKVFLKVAEHQSITRAAEELFLTQPAVSIQLKKFQEQFSIPLTEIIGRKLYVTDFGKEIVQAAQKIIDQVEAINYRTSLYKNQLAGKLKISVASTGKYVMPFFLSDFMHLHPGVDLSMDVTNKTLVVKSLDSNEVDFALVSVIPDQLKTDSIELLKNKLYLVGSPNLRGEEGEHDVSRIFHEHPLVYREPGSATRAAMEAYVEKHGATTRKKLELTSNEAVKQAVRAGLGYTIMPLIGIRNELKNGDLEIIPQKELPITTTWNLIWLKAKNLSPVALSYLEHLRNSSELIKKEWFRWYEEY